MRLIVTGWRGAKPEHHTQTISDALYPIYLSHEANDVTLVHGKCKFGGVDLIADGLARGWSWNVEAHPADEVNGRILGPARNRHMCSLGADLVLAFPGPGSRGTWDCLRWAQRYGIPFQGYPLVISRSRTGA